MLQGVVYGGPAHMVPVCPPQLWITWSTYPHKVPPRLSGFAGEPVNMVPNL